MKILILILPLFLSGCFAVDKFAENMLYPFSKLNKKNKNFKTPSELIELNEDGSIAWFEDGVEGKPTLYLHGNGVDLKVMYETGYFTFFKNIGLAAVSVQYPGVGTAKGKPNQESLVNSALAIFDWAYENSGKKVIIWGRSLGCAVAAQVANRRQDKVERLILISPWLTFKKAAVAKMRLAKRMSKKFVKAHEYNTKGLEWETLPNTLIIHGTKDKLIPFSHGEKLAEIMDAKFFPAKGLAHNDLYSSAEVIDTIKEFINE